MDKWIWVIVLAVVGFVLGLLLNKKILKAKRVWVAPALLAMACALTAIRFIVCAGSDCHGNEISDKYRFLQTAAYSVMSCILLVLAYKIKGFDYEEAARKRSGLAADDPRLEKKEELSGEDKAESEKSSRLLEFVFLALLLCLGVAAAWLFNDVEMVWWHRAIGFVAASVPFLAMGRKTESYKDGEVLLMATGGVVLGWKNILLAVFLGIVFSSATASFKLLTRSREEKGKKLKPMRMAPFLSLGIFVAALYGNEFLNWFYQLYMK